MRCKHGVVGGCIACDQEQWRSANAIRVNEVVQEMGWLVLQLAEKQGVDYSKLKELLDVVKKAGLR